MTHLLLTKQVSSPSSSLLICLNLYIQPGARDLTRSPRLLSVQMESIVAGAPSPPVDVNGQLWNSQCDHPYMFS